MDRCGECDQIFLLACATCGLLGNAGVDLVDLDVNEAGMRLSLKTTSWSEAGERLRSRVASWSGKTCMAGTDSAHQRVCPGGSFGWYGCFRTAPSVQHRIGRMRRLSTSKMPTWKLQPSWTSMLRMLCRVCCWLASRQMSRRRQFQSSRKRRVRERELRSSVNLVSVKRMATTMLRSCRRT